MWRRGRPRRALDPEIAGSNPATATTRQVLPPLGVALAGYAGAMVAVAAGVPALVVILAVWFTVMGLARARLI